MKIIVTASAGSEHAEVEKRFGRCSHLVVYDDETNNYISNVNPGSQTSGGAGIATARAITEFGAGAVLVGNIGPNAVRVLKAARVEIYSGITGTIMESVALFKNNKLSKITEANVKEHHGV